MSRTRPLLALLAVVLVPVLALAQSPVIAKVRIGLPNGTSDGGRMRQGAWTPVYITMNAAKDGNGQQQFKLVLDAQDAEENPYRYTVPVPALLGGVQEVVIGYLRSPNQDFTVTLQTIAGQTLQGPVKQPRSLDSEPLKPSLPLIVVMGGASLPKLKVSLLPAPAKVGEVDDAQIDAQLARGYARLSKVNDMPDRWFGYDAADVVLLATDNDTFMKELTAASAAARRKALAEWVRRGGKLVLSVGRNHQLVNSLLASMPLPEVDKMPLVPFETTGSVQRKLLPSVNRWASFGLPELGQDSKNGVEVAQLALGTERAETKGLGDGVTVLLYEKPEERKDKGLPLLVQSSCGLGRVLVIAFDVDAAPFNTWPGQVNFWKALLSEVSDKQFTPELLKQQESNWQGNDSPELAGELYRSIELFDEVPVVSFGWVALFIFVYILLVGPVDYFVLKKVFKRLELTWITFPTAVITISVGAYFIAYALKGDDLRVNKIDLVEIDLHTPQAYGTSWFSVFSPRMQNYTLGVEPVFSAGKAGSLTAAKASTTVSVLENQLAATRGGSTSLFRQPYEYTEDAAGLEHVPIPVWATRSFMATWRTSYSPDKPPFRADLTRSEGGIVTGKLVNELPVDLEDVCLFYRNHWYPLVGHPTLTANGDLFNVANLNMSDNNGSQVNAWYGDPILNSGRLPQGGPGQQAQQWQNGGQQPAEIGPGRMKPLLFYPGFSSPSVKGNRNNGVRELSQTWRLALSQEGGGPAYRDEVILVARTAYASGKAKKINEDSLVQLWNDRLPAAGETCPPLPGFLKQETYVRIYIPVK